MPPKFFESILSHKKKLTDDVYEFGFDLKNPAEIEFKAGQFLNIRVEDGSPKMLFRSYSIMSSPREKNHIKTCIKIIPDGRCSKWLEKECIGKTVTFMGPVGLFTFNEASKKNVLFIATGTGITPFYSMISDQLEKGNAASMNLLWGFRYEKDIFYQEHFQELQKKYPNFSCTTTISRAEESWKGVKGRVTEYLMKNPPDAANTQVYICGVGEMVLEVKNLCIQQGIPPADIHFERYT